MAHRHEAQRKHGGKTRVAYTGAGSNVVKEAESTSDGFKKGGKVHGKKGKHRIAKRARGGRSGSPFSSAHTGHGAEGPGSHHEPHHSKHARGGKVKPTPLPDQPPPEGLRRGGRSHP